MFAQEAIKIEPHPLAYLWQAIALHELGRDADALESCRQGLSLKPSSSEKDNLNSWIRGIEKQMAEQAQTQPV